MKVEAGLDNDEGPPLENVCAQEFSDSNQDDEIVTPSMLKTKE